MNILLNFSLQEIKCVQVEFKIKQLIQLRHIMSKYRKTRNILMQSENRATNKQIPGPCTVKSSVYTLGARLNPILARKKIVNQHRKANRQ